MGCIGGGVIHTILGARNAPAVSGVFLFIICLLFVDLVFFVLYVVFVIVFFCFCFFLFTKNKQNSLRILESTTDRVLFSFLYFHFSPLQVLWS